MRRAAGATPNANGRAIDFDQKDRRKRTREDAKMRREMPNTSCLMLLLLPAVSLRGSSKPADTPYTTAVPPPPPIAGDPRDLPLFLNGKSSTAIE
jgi:hypothetical protein